MDKIDIDPLKLEKVNISVSNLNGETCIIFSGIIDMRNPSAEILPYLVKIHSAVLEKGIKNTVVNLSELTFMNSSGIKTIITWIMNLKDVQEDERYTLKILYNPEITWQESSIEILQQLFPDLLILEKIQSDK